MNKLLILTLLVSTSLFACGSDIVIEDDSPTPSRGTRIVLPSTDGGSGGQDDEDVLVAAQTSTVASTSTGGPSCDQQCGLSDCEPGSECYDFKLCYEDVQNDPAAVQECVNAHTEGSSKWAELVKCVCSYNGCDDTVPATFCTNLPYGHPAG